MTNRDLFTLAPNYHLLSSSSSSAGYFSFQTKEAICTAAQARIAESQIKPEIEEHSLRPSA